MVDTKIFYKIWLVFCYKSNLLFDPKDRIRADYQYFYINKLSPSPVELYNFWGSSEPTPNYTGKTVEYFSNEFLYNGYLTIKPYLESSSSKSAKLINTYDDGGLYPPIIKPSVKGLVYNTYNDLLYEEINSSIYLTFETELNIPVGLPLVYYKK